MKNGSPHSFTGWQAPPAKKGSVCPVQERREAKPLDIIWWLTGHPCPDCFLGRTNGELF